MSETSRVLFVEDDKVDQMAFERLVRDRRLAYEYTIATSLAEARKLLGEREFDVILSDYFLPDGTAVELFEQAPNAPIVVITGAGDEEIAVQAMKAGAYDYLTKDFDRKYLRMLPITLENAIRQKLAERQFKMLTHAIMSINDAVFITDMDERIVYVNKTFLRTYGYAEDDVLDRPSSILWADPSQTNSAARDERLDEIPKECLHRRRDGSTVPISLSRSVIRDEHGREMAIVGVARDMIQRKEAEQALKESEERYALAALGANDGLWDWDLRRGGVYFSPRWKAMLGFQEEDIGTRPEDWFGLVHRDDLASLKAHIEAHLEGRTPHFECEYRMRHKSGGYRWMLARGLAVRDGDRRAHRIAGSQTDISDRKRVEQQLLHDALHDALTGLANRSLFLDRLENAVKRARRRTESAFGVLFLDLDRFKVVNDSLGHLVGDQLLIAIARRLEGCLRLGDTVARLGGDEFAILLEDLDDLTYVHRVADRTQRELEMPYILNGQEVYTSASIGIALSDTGYERAEDLLRDADTAMYRAKALGKGRRVVFDPTMHARAMGQLRLETDLRRAEERGELLLHYQPIVALARGEISGFEALLRWQHPERGLLYPEDFLSLAQETGLIVGIGRWVLATACRQLKAWQDRFPAPSPLTLSVNLDSKQLAQGDLVQEVEDTLKDTGLDPRTLRLEITEGAIMENPEFTTSILEQLRLRGVQIQIDDFGTGYSSLSHLHRFPIDALKIDRSFVSRMNLDEVNAEIVGTIVTLAHKLRMEVMAEGVETDQQLARLKEMGCEFGQGYLFSEPLGPDPLVDLLAKKRRW